MIRRRPCTSSAPVPLHYLNEVRGNCHNHNADELAIDEDDQSEIVNVLRKEAESQEETMERIQSWIGIAATSLALILPFLSEATNSPLAWMHALYTAIIVSFVSSRTSVSRLTTSPNRSLWNVTTTTTRYDAISLRWLCLFSLSSLPLAVWIVSLSRRGINYSELIVALQQHEHYGLHFSLSLINLIMFGGALLINFESQSIKQALNELEASKYRYKSL